MTLYDAIIITFIVIAAVGAVWASRKLNKASRDGKINYIGKVRMDK